MKRQKKRPARQVRAARPEGQTDLTERIAQRAFEIYLERGHDDGRDLDDWLQAEQEILENERKVKS